MITGLPPSSQDDVAGEKGPIAPTFKLIFPAAPDPPLVLSSTTTMSFPALVGALGVRGIPPPPASGASTTKVCVLESNPLGFSSCTGRFPADCRSGAFRDAMH